MGNGTGWGHAGTGTGHHGKAGPPIYSTKGGGSTNKPPKRGSGGGSKSTVIIGFLLLGVPLVALGSIVAYLLHGYNVI